MKRIAHIYNKFEEYVLVISIVFTVSIIFYQVIMRFIFNDSPSWTEEIARYVFIWQIWLGASAGLKDGKHIRLELLPDVLKKKHLYKTVSIIELIVLLAWIGLTIFLTVGGIEFVQGIAARNAVSSGMRIPLVFVYAALPVTCFIATLRIAGLMIIETRKLLKGGEVA